MRSGVKFLMLEDNKYDQKLIERELKKFSQNCIIKSLNKKEGFLELLQQYKPDIILSDYHLGLATGMDVLKIAKKHGPETPFIIVTGTLGEETVVSCLKQGAWDYVLKDKLYKLAPAIDHAFEIQQGILEKKKSEKALAESEERLKLILDRNPIPIAVVDVKDDVIQYWSQSARQMFGHDPKTTKEWYILAYPDPKYRKEVLERWKPFLEKAKKSGNAINTGEYNITCKDGSIKICELYAQFIPGNLVVTLNDITASKDNEKKLQQHLKELEIFNEASVDRELMINDHRKEINELLKKLGKEPKYEIVE
ncbi:MAG: response regulator [Candidatus Cloacimonetes bacterium]|nr:response regulator [Candidatus Cloacimonadota bacterium]MCF7868225.1 response regulator [Candidatus Cloacimonadota bacterium]MCF7883658.1 response regulator [Candidatus Cloacimonadota bacterium]